MFDFRLKHYDTILKLHLDIAQMILYHMFNTY